MLMSVRRILNKQRHQELMIPNRRDRLRLQYPRRFRLPEDLLLLRSLLDVRNLQRQVHLHRRPPCKPFYLLSELSLRQLFHLLHLRRQFLRHQESLKLPAQRRPELTAEYLLHLLHHQRSHR
jgi:hypothetical protein